METTDCPHYDNYIHCTLFDNTICISRKLGEKYAEDILNDVILLQNVFKLIIPIDNICCTCTILEACNIRIELSPRFNVPKYAIAISSLNYLKCGINVDELIAYLDDKFPELRQDNCSKMALK